jgi:hypothetical protein
LRTWGTTDASPPSQNTRHPVAVIEPIKRQPAILRSTTAGAMTSYAIPQPSGFSEVAEGVTSASDGNVWYVADRSVVGSGAAIDELSIGNVTSSGAFADYPIADPAGNQYRFNAAIVDGLDGALYSLARSDNQNTTTVYLARVTHAGAATIAAPQVIGTTALPPLGTLGYGVRGKDGNIYYDVQGTSLIKLVY